MHFRSKSKSVSRRSLLTVLVVLLCGAMGVQALISSLNLDDIKGMRGELAAREATRRENYSKRKYVRSNLRRNRSIGQRRRHNRNSLRFVSYTSSRPQYTHPKYKSKYKNKKSKSLKTKGSQQKTGGKKSSQSSKLSPTKPSSSQPSITPIPAETPLQNLTLRVVDIHRKPVPGLRLVATVHSQKAGATNAKGLVTDARGLVKLHKVGPLPAVLDIDVARESSTEWQIANAQSASLFFPRPLPGSSRIVRWEDKGTEEQGSEKKTNSEYESQMVAHSTPGMFVNPQSKPIRLASLQLTGDLLPTIVSQERSHWSQRLALLQPTSGQSPFKRIQYENSISKNQSSPGWQNWLVGQRYARAFAPRQRSLARQRAVIYDSPVAQTVVVQRTIVNLDIAAPPGSIAFAPFLAGGQQQVPSSGHIFQQVPVSLLSDGPLPIRISQTLPGGEAEAVIDDYPVSTDQTANNVATSPPLRLAALSNIILSRNLSVGSSKEDVIRALGDLGGGKANKKNALGKISPLADGSEWWVYPALGLGFKLRLIPVATKKDPSAIVERIRVFGSAGGSVGGMTVGSEWTTAFQALGEPESRENSTPDATGRLLDPSDALSNRGEIALYLERGLRVCQANGKVQWFDLTRPTPLLQEGTTAFVARERPRLFIQSFFGHSRTNLRNVNDLRRYLQQVHSVVLVNSREAADLVLEARADFAEDKDDFTELIPYRYECTTKLSYSLFDVNQNRYVIERKEVSGVAKADYSKKAVQGTALALGAAILLGKTGKVAAGVIGVAGSASLHRSMQKAANRCPGISARTAFNSLTEDINRAADFAVRVTGIDYATGRLYLNVGSNVGLRAWSPQTPYEFQISVGGTPLPYSETGVAADYYSAKVVSVTPTTAICELKHIRRTIGKTSEKTEENLDPRMVKRIIDPASGLVSARAWVQFASLPVISDQDIERTLEKENPQNNQAE